MSQEPSTARIPIFSLVTVLAIMNYVPMHGNIGAGRTSETSRMKNSYFTARYASYINTMILLRSPRDTHPMTLRYSMEPIVSHLQRQLFHYQSTHKACRQARR